MGNLKRRRKRERQSRILPRKERCDNWVFLEKKGGILCCSWNGERQRCGELCICLLLRKEIHELWLIGIATTSCRARPGQIVLHELFYQWRIVHYLINNAYKIVSWTIRMTCKSGIGLGLE